jgi:hypothetical protein
MAGKRFCELVEHFEMAVPIGVETAAGVVVFPHPGRSALCGARGNFSPRTAADFRITADTKIIVISESADSYAASPTPINVSIRGLL